MSYAAKSSSLSVGSAARKDPILANASLAASKIMLQATRKPESVRRAFVANSLNSVQPGLASIAAADRRARVARGVNPNQATFDAMRLGIAKARMGQSISSLREHGLGDFAPNDRQTACTIAAGAQVVGGVAQVVPVYGTIVGGILGIGASIAGGALDCTREQREAAAAAQQAQQNLMMAQQQQAGAQQSATQQASRNRMIQYAMIGGGTLGVLGVLYYALS